jgi:dTDP-glucose 4,6-dehydratase
LKIIVTGGAGFIGTSVVRHLLGDCNTTVVSVDKLTYAASPPAFGPLDAGERYFLEVVDICDRTALTSVLARHRPDAIVHLAAETHVDRSIGTPDAFVRTNLVGTFELLEAVRAYWSALSAAAAAKFRFLHVSTDEVFGSLGPDGRFNETTAYDPSSPYSASKAGADHLVRAWHRTYGLPVVLTNCSNNYGPWQFPEKLIPLTILNAIEGLPLPIYGDGGNVRDWLFVGDHASALALVLKEGSIGETYAIGGRSERRNVDIVRELCAILDDELQSSPYRPHESLIHFVADRPGHDFRYAIDASKIHRELRWVPTESLVTGLRRTIRWYLANRDWWEPIRRKRYSGDRVGLLREAE